MPKIIELTVEIDIQKVSCPGVWLCQGGCVCLTVFALGTSYQTCFLPPIFPLMFKDVFYFKKRYQEACALNNICCLLKDETIYCELVQCSSKCVTDNCVILAQYLGTMNDVLFPPNMCANDGVDLLMRRSKIFPGILSPKIEIATKVRIDELWNQPATGYDLALHECLCKPPFIEEGIRQKQVCHSARYHRAKCDRQMRSPSRSRSPCRSKSAASSSCKRNKKNCGDNPSCVSSPKRPRSPRTGPMSRNYCVYPFLTSITRQDEPLRRKKSNDYSDDEQMSIEPNIKGNRSSSPSSSPRDCYVYNVQIPCSFGRKSLNRYDVGSDESLRQIYNSSTVLDYTEPRNSKVTLRSTYIDCEPHCNSPPKEIVKYYHGLQRKPCICEICTRYHELFHCD